MVAAKSGERSYFDVPLGVHLYYQCRDGTFMGWKKGGHYPAFWKRSLAYQTCLCSNNQKPVV